MPTLSDLWADFSTSELPKLGYPEGYQHRWSEQIEPHFGLMRATAIEPHHLEEHLARRRSERNDRGVPSEGELKHEINVPRRLLNWAVDTGRVSHTRIAYLREHPRGSRGYAVIDPASVTRLVEEADDPRAIYILLHFDCFLVHKEIEALEWCHLLDGQQKAEIVGRGDSVPISDRTWERIQGLKQKRVEQDDADSRILKSSSWRRDIRQLALRVLGTTSIEGESIGCLMFRRSALYWASLGQGGGLALERNAGLKHPARERGRVPLTPSEASAAAERHQAAVSR